MGKLVLVFLYFLISINYLYADYRCKATLIEHVPIFKIYFKEVDGKEIDFKKGVPENQIIKKEDYNPKLFDGSYQLLDFVVDSANGKGAVLYTKRFFTRNMLEIKEECYKIPHDKACYLPIYNSDTGTIGKPSARLVAKSEDKFFDGGADVFGGILVVKDFDYLMIGASAYKSASFLTEEPDKDDNSFEVEGYSKISVPIGEGFGTFVYGKSKLYNMHVSLEVGCEKK